MLMCISFDNDDYDDDDDDVDDDDDDDDDHNMQSSSWKVAKNLKLPITTCILADNHLRHPK